MDQTPAPLEKPERDRWAEIGGGMEEPKMKTNGVAGVGGQQKEAENRDTGTNFQSETPAP